MRTAKQIAASRANGAKSRGATTPAGRARIVAANVRSGVFANSPILPGEDPAELAQLTREYHDHYAPTTPEHHHLVTRLIACEWLLRRFNRIEARSMHPHIQHRINATRRAFRAASALTSNRDQCDSTP